MAVNDSNPKAKPRSGPPPRRKSAAERDSTGPSPEAAAARPRRRRRVEEPVESEPSDNPLDEAPETEEPRRWFASSSAKNFTAFLVSTVTHLIALLCLGLWMLPAPAQQELLGLVVDVTPRENEELTTELDTAVDASVTTDASAVSVESGVADGSIGAVGAASSNTPTLDATVSEQVEGVGISLEAPRNAVPKGDQLIRELPVQARGDARAIVDNYDQAMDRLTQEILLKLAKQKLLLVWAFDESESMKNDQREIRDRIDRVYAELGLTGKTNGDALLTSVVSFGETFRVHTPKPTNVLRDIRQAIDAVPNDPTGKENTCSALGQTMNLFGRFTSGERRMIVVLVTDETGEREDNERFLEPMLAEAKKANCTIYILGREAVFGYPYAHFLWVNPETGSHHWLPVDRGPETGFVEQLQTDGFRRRYDAHSSGFGPYEQSRMAQQTGGIFFMLPSVEQNIIWGEKRKYELEAMRAYQPDLRSRQELVAEKDASPLRAGITKVIYDLNPYRPEIAKYIEVRFHFSPQFDPFAKQAQQELEKAKMYVTYLDAAQNYFENDLRRELPREYNPRWQANYELLYAQVLAYKVRIYEYGAFLDGFVKAPPKVPHTKPPNLTLGQWNMHTRKETITGELTADYIKRSEEAFRNVIRNHPGTPWAARAEWELSRGFGVALSPAYHGPPSPHRPSGKPVKHVPIPKL